MRASCGQLRNDFDRKICQTIVRAELTEVWIWRLGYSRENGCGIEVADLKDLALLQHLSEFPLGGLREIYLFNLSTIRQM